MKSLITSLFFIAFAFSMHANNNFKEMKQKASQHYEEGKYTEALDIWNDLAFKGNTDPNLFFNIGNAESMLGHIPESMLAFEKAARLKPADRLIKEAIKKERAKIENAVIPVTPFFLIEWYHQLLSLFRPGGWVFVGVLFIAFSLLQWLTFIHALKKSRLLQGKNQWIFLSSGALFFLMGIFSFQQIHKDGEAIIMVSCESRQAASTESPVTRTLHPGEKVLITDQIGDWNKISLLNLDEGWVKKECLRHIVIGEE